MVYRFFQIRDTKRAEGCLAVDQYLTIGAKPYLSIQLPISIVAGTIGLWLSMPSTEGVYWSRHGDWDPLRAALEGNSYYKLPKLRQWCTGSIGLHHIHHAHPGVPNYIPEVHPERSEALPDGQWLDRLRHRHPVMGSLPANNRLLRKHPDGYFRPETCHERPTLDKTTVQSFREKGFCTILGPPSAY